LVQIRKGAAQMNRMLAASVAISVFALPALAAHAAGPFDGTWQVDSGGLGTPTAQAMEGTGCEPEILRFEVKDNKIGGGLAYAGSDPNRVENSQGPRSAPITGSVQPDGTLTAQWENFTVTGKLSGNQAELHWRAPCGPRVAMGSRIAPAAESGSSTGK
jgi:hypothetical protein